MAETRYWMGESFSEMGDHLRAACEFLRIGYLYPKEGQWAGTASYMAGAECEKAGLTDHAAAIYRQNVRKFGKTSDWGKASDERLTELLKAKETSKRIQPLGEKEPPKDKEAPGAK
jgi:TolA-binding protein